MRHIVGETIPKKRHKKGENRNVDITGRIEVVLSIA